MRVTVVQLSNDPSQLQSDMRKLSQHVQAEKSEFVLLPEMTFSPWLASNRDSNDRQWQEAVALHQQWIEQFSALALPPLVSTRPIVNGNGSRRNQGYLWTENNGVQAIHEKYYLPNEPGYWEASWYDMGDSLFDTARLGEVRIGIQICTEMWFFQHSRELGQKQVDLLCVPRVTPHASIDKWLAGGQAGAVVSGAFHLSSNMYLPESSAADIGGLSWIISPEGDVLGTTDPDNPFITIDVDLNISDLAKHTYPRYVKT
ncbi:MAG: N-carbamoylputrescine amidase [Oceanospirillaceae bacterium]|jgi:N-carbamoylputrescine amidase